MGILKLIFRRLNVSASTQCDIRTVEKAKFLSDVRFTQIVLARELNLNKIRAIHQLQTTWTIYHGALSSPIRVSATFLMRKQGVAPTVAISRRAVCHTR